MTLKFCEVPCLWRRTEMSLILLLFLSSFVLNPTGWFAFSAVFFVAQQQVETPAALTLLHCL